MKEGSLLLKSPPQNASSETTTQVISSLFQEVQFFLFWDKGLLLDKQLFGIFIELHVVHVLSMD